MSALTSPCKCLHPYETEEELAREIRRLRASLEQITKLSPSAEYAGPNAVFIAQRALVGE